MNLAFKSKDQEIVLYPTGKCFDDALDYLEFLVKEDPSRAHTTEYQLAHGILDSGEYLYSHAWIETKESVIDGRILNDEKVMAEYDKTGFYIEMKVVERTLYTVKEACELNYISGHYGPWIEKYRKLCRN